MFSLHSFFSISTCSSHTFPDRTRVFWCHAFQPCSTEPVCAVPAIPPRPQLPCGAGGDTVPRLQHLTSTGHHVPASSLPHLTAKSGLAPLLFKAGCELGSPAPRTVLLVALASGTPWSPWPAQQRKGSWEFGHEYGKPVVKLTACVCPDRDCAWGQVSVRTGRYLGCTSVYVHSPLFMSYFES